MSASACSKNQRPGRTLVAPGPLCWFVLLALVCAGCAGCERPKPPPPDGTSGVRGVALAPAEGPHDNGDVPPRQPWTGVRVSAMLANSPDADYKTDVRTFVDAQGRFEFALNPGQYLIGVYDPERLTGKMSSPMLIKVEPGKFTEIVVDYDKLNVRDLPPAR